MWYIFTAWVEIKILYILIFTKKNVTFPSGYTRLNKWFVLNSAHFM